MENGTDTCMHVVVDCLNFKLAANTAAKALKAYMYI